VVKMFCITSASMRIRSATPADIPAMMSLERHAVTAAHWREEEYLRVFNEDMPRRIALILEESVPVAFLVAGKLDREWEIENVAVAPDARRRGLGTRLVGEFLDLARREGAARILLEVRESNAAARALYEKWAFVETGRRRGYYSNPIEDAVVYSFSFPTE
jgi:[ribosomal protein S18]-alanine N-acetyltransferase